MQICIPKIIQGGMGVAVSNWRLAQAVSRLGQLGVVSGTALDQVFARRLQDGDPGGHVRRALSHFPFPKMAQRTLDAFWQQDGRRADVPYKMIEKAAIRGARWVDELCIVANFVEVFLAREHHDHPVGINYLEKIQLPHLPSIYGAMLAGVAVVIVGAGIPLEIPAVLEVLANHQAATYPIRVHGAQPDTETHKVFNPADFFENGVPAPLLRPRFLPIVSSDVLAGMILRKAAGKIDGFIVEGPLAGGHNAPPRGVMQLTAGGEPIYGPRDVISLEGFRALGVPFWLGGSYGTPERVAVAIDQGAAGVQVGTAFALCVESGLREDLRRELVRRAQAGTIRVFTDPKASPTGFPFKVAQLEGSAADPAVFAARRRICDLGFLREAYRKDDNTVGYRCPAEPVEAFVAKGGKPEECVGRLCVCNGLFSSIGQAQVLADGRHEAPLVTLGDDVVSVPRFCVDGQLDYTAADVIRVLLG